MLVTLEPNSSEYVDVADRFNSTCGNFAQIVKVERVQNEALWRSYAVYRKFTVAEGNGGDANERRLFHGTNADIIDRIATGANICFDRSYTKIHVYGKGVYFAREASYSANARYSPKDKVGYQRMYLARVAVGTSTVGSESFTAPPEKSRGQVFDSTVDRLDNPNVFVVYRDHAAYPEYIITFTA